MMISSSDILVFQGKKCRRAYTRMLKMAQDDHVPVKLNSGYRSVLEQWKLWYAYKRGQGPLAAYPGSSTHNKKDYRQGLDLDNVGTNGTMKFIAWAKEHGMIWTLTVPGESWHINAHANYDNHINKMWRNRELTKGK